MQTSDSSSRAADRRQNPRTKLVEIAYIGMGPENGGLVLDVSEGGLSFHSVAPIQRDEKVQFLLSLRGHSRIEGTGEVVWTNHVGTVCGLKFTSLSPGALDHLNNWKAQTNTSAPPRGNAVAQRPPSVTPPNFALEASTLKLESPAPAFAVAPSVEHDHSVHITEVRGQSPLFWVAVGALTTAFAAVAFFYGVRVGKAYYTVPSQAIEINTAKPNPSPAVNEPGPPAQYPIERSAAAASAPADSKIENPATSHEFVNASKSVGISGTNPTVTQPMDRMPTPTSAATPIPAPAATRPPVEVAKPAQTPDSNPRLSPDDGKSEYAAAIADLNGDNGKRDTVAAIQLLQVASKKGDTLAEVTLADLYIYGDGVAQDCVRGKSLLAEAAKNGNMQAKVKLEELTADGCP